MARRIRPVDTRLMWAQAQPWPMRLSLLVAATCTLLAGCASSPSPDAVDAAASPESLASLPDVGVHETYDLSRGLPETTWSFDVAQNASGHVLLTLRGAATDDRVIRGEVCLDYDIPRGSATQSSRSTCGGINLSVAVVVFPTNDPVLEVRGLAPGPYRITASAPVQANELVVDIVVDNP